MSLFPYCRAKQNHNDAVSISHHQSRVLSESALKLQELLTDLIVDQLKKPREVIQIALADGQKHFWGTRGPCCLLTSASASLRIRRIPFPGRYVTSLKTILRSHPIG